jgi:acetyl esterase/lipase
VTAELAAMAGDSGGEGGLGHGGDPGVAARERERPIPHGRRAQSASPAPATHGILRGVAGDVVPFPQAPEGIELRHLRAFVAVAEELNFSRAAARLYVSQPALSRQIRALERLLGCELLRRSTHRVELTVAGSALLDRSRRLLAEFDEAITATQSVGGELANRMATLWAPVFEIVAADRDFQEMRATYENFLAQAPVPDNVDVRPVNAGGVSSLELGVGSELSGAVLYLHGGGYTLGSAYGYRPLVGALVTAARVDALVPDFRLAPEHPFPAAVEDALSAYRWLAERRGPVVLAGDSAGAGLACSLLVMLKAQGLTLPAAGVFLSPGFDMTGGPRFTPGDRETVSALLRSSDAYLAGHPADDPVVNPLAADFTGMPPLLIQAATGDFALAQARALAEHAAGHGVDARLELYAADTHVFHVFWSFLPEAADALESAGIFIREALAADRAHPRAARREL